MVALLEGFREAQNLDPDAYVFQGIVPVVEEPTSRDMEKMFAFTRHVLERGRYRFRLADGRTVFVLWGMGDLPAELQGHRLRVTDWQGNTQTLAADELVLGEAPVYAEVLP